MTECLQKIAFATTISIASFISNMGIGFAAPLGNNIPTHPNPQIDTHPTSLNQTTISGDVKITFDQVMPQSNLQCKDFLISAVLIGNGINFFYLSKNLTGNFNTGNCHYSVSTEPKNIGKAVSLHLVVPDGYKDVSLDPTTVVPNQPLNLNIAFVISKQIVP
jgi:hypothetical protein